MKHFLQKFAPGADRLAGVEHIEGSNGAAILRPSWMSQGDEVHQMRVSQRMSQGMR